MTSNQVFENRQLETKTHWKINHIVITEYIILALNIFHSLNSQGDHQK